MEEKKLSLRAGSTDQKNSGETYLSLVLDHKHKDNINAKKLCLRAGLPDQKKSGEFQSINDVDSGDEKGLKEKILMFCQTEMVDAER